MHKTKLALGVIAAATVVTIILALLNLMPLAVAVLACCIAMTLGMSVVTFTAVRSQIATNTRRIEARIAKIAQQHQVSPREPFTVKELDKPFTVKELDKKLNAVRQDIATDNAVRWRLQIARHDSLLQQVIENSRQTEHLTKAVAKLYAEVAPSKPQKATLTKQAHAAVAKHAAALENIWSLISVTQKHTKLSNEQKRNVLNTLYAPLSYKDIKESFVMDAIRSDVGVSFRSSMSNMMRFKSRLRKNGLVIAPGGNDKLADQTFAQRLGVPTPMRYQEEVPISELELRPNSIIKPKSGAGSRGVFFVNSDLVLRSLKTGKSYSTLGSALGEHPSDPKSVKWISEQAIIDENGDLAHDLKVFMFYGEPGYVLEIDRNSLTNRKPRYSYYWPDGSVARVTPRRRNSIGAGITDDLIEKAKVLSLNSPTPFLRLDFLRGADESYLGEITPHPGMTYAKDLYESVDKKLGDLFLNAEARLMIDLMAGKDFTIYHEVYNTHR